LTRSGTNGAVDDMGAEVGEEAAWTRFPRDKQSGNGAKLTIPSARRRGMSPEPAGGWGSGGLSFTGTQPLERLVTDQAKTSVLAMIAGRTVPLKLSGFAAPAWSEGRPPMPAAAAPVAA